MQLRGIKQIHNVVILLAPSIFRTLLMHDIILRQFSSISSLLILFLTKKVLNFSDAFAF